MSGCKKRKASSSPALFLSPASLMPPPPESPPEPASLEPLSQRPPSLQLLLQRPPSLQSFVACARVNDSKIPGIDEEIIGTPKGLKDVMGQSSMIQPDEVVIARAMLDSHRVGLSQENWNDDQIKTLLHHFYHELSGDYSSLRCLSLPERLTSDQLTDELTIIRVPNRLTKQLGHGTFGKVYEQGIYAIKRYKDRNILVRALVICKELDALYGKDAKSPWPHFYGVSSCRQQPLCLGICMEKFGLSVLNYCENVQSDSRFMNTAKVALIESIIAQMAAGLIFLRNRGIFPRDLKPCNTLFHQGVVKFCDVDDWLIFSGDGPCCGSQKCSIDEIELCMTRVYAPQEQISSGSVLTSFRDKPPDKFLGYTQNGCNLYAMVWCYYSKMIKGQGYLEDAKKLLQQEIKKGCGGPFLRQYWEGVNRHALVYAYLELTCCLLFEGVEYQKLIIDRFMTNKLIHFGDSSQRPSYEAADTGSRQVIQGLSAGAS